MVDQRAGRQLILVDGRSGSGKTWWASRRATETGLLLLSLDELYPGWDGLDAGHWVAYTKVILRWSAGEVATVRRWDWQAMAPGDEMVIPADVDLLIEGCGALSTFTAPYATQRYWLEADGAVRKQRALERDGDVFSPHWLRWALQEDRFYALHGSKDLADVVIHT